MTMILGYRENPNLKSDGGYDYNTRSYVFRPILESKPGMIATAAVMMCQECRTIIKSMGGPGYRCYCVKCYDVLKLTDFAEGHKHEIVEK